jgi:hypothetical protein
VNWNDVGVAAAAEVTSITEAPAAVATSAVASTTFIQDRVRDICAEAIPD